MGEKATVSTEMRYEVQVCALARAAPLLMAAYWVWSTKKGLKVFGGATVKVNVQVCGTLLSIKGRGKRRHMINRSSAWCSGESTCVTLILCRGHPPFHRLVPQLGPR